MEYNYMEEQKPQGSIVRGLIGALIGAILGAIVWGVVGILTQSVFTVIGILMGFLTAKGYDLLKGRQGAAKIVIVILCLIIAVVLGEAIYNVGMIHKTYLEGIDEVAAELEGYGIDLKALLETNPDEAYEKYIYTEMEILQMYIEDKTFWSDVVKNLAQAMFFAAIGAAVVIIDFIGKNKQQTAAIPASAPDSANAPEAAGENDPSVTPDP